MPESSMTFEQIDALVGKLNLADFAVEGKVATAIKANPSVAIPQICPIYKAVKPILQFIAKILPAKWQQIINAFIGIMDGLCP
jgi:hypothetical protein